MPVDTTLTASNPPARTSAAALVWLITACLMLQPLSTDLYLASLPHLARELASTPAKVQQTLSLFVISFGTAQLILGPLSDRYGRRPVLLGGLALYVLASVMCAFANSVNALIVLRIAQAVGCCSAVVVARAVVRDAYAPDEGARIIAQAGSLLTLAPLLSPILGGYLQVAFGWRAAFVALVVYGALLMIVIWHQFSETNLEKNADALKLSGFVRNYREILGRPEFWAYALPGALSYASIFVFLSGAPFVLINLLKVPTDMFGYAWALGVSGYLAGAIICRRLLAKRDIIFTLKLATTSAALAGISFATAALSGLQHWATVVVSLFLTMFAHGMNWPCAQAGAVSPFPHLAGTAAGLLGFFTMFAALLVGTWIGASYDGTLHPMALTSAGIGCAILLSAHLLRRWRRRVTR